MPHFDFYVKATDPAAGLKFSVRVDQCLIFDSIINSSQQLEIPFRDDGQAHVLTWSMSEKQPCHTTVDSHGNIIADAVLNIEIFFESNNLGDILAKHCVYQHNFNGSGVDTIEKFYGVMGCNGTIELKFNTPIYMWLLENL